MARLIILIPVLLSVIALSGCSREKKIGSIPSCLIGDWGAINFPYDEFPDVKNNYSDEGVTRIKIRSDRYFDGQAWVPIDLTRLTVEGGNEFTFFKKNGRSNDGWRVIYLDDPSKKFKRYRGSILIHDFMARGEEMYEHWLEVGYFEKR